MNSVALVQLHVEILTFLHSVNTLKEGINQIISLPTAGKY